MDSAAIQGIKGSYSEEAARKFFGKNIQILECGNFVDAFQSVENCDAKFAVIPFKNKIVGDIETPKILFEEGKLQIVDEITLEIRHVLVGTSEARQEDLKKVFSHIEALKQCGDFFSKNQHLQQIKDSDTASSIKKIVTENIPENAAIGSRRAAEIYGGKILLENIADVLDNWTTFYVLAK